MAAPPPVKLRQLRPSCMSGKMIPRTHLPRIRPLFIPPHPPSSSSTTSPAELRRAPTPAPPSSAPAAPGAGKGDQLAIQQIPAARSSLATAVVKTAAAVRATLHALLPESPHRRRPDPSSLAMTMASRLLSRSKQLYVGGAMLQRDHAVHVRSFVKEAAPLKGDEMLKNIFYDVKNKFETTLGILRKEKITIDPDDPAALTQYAKEIRAKSGLIDELGAEHMMLEALKKVEKAIKKLLLRSDKKNMVFC